MTDTAIAQDNQPQDISKAEGSRPGLLSRVARHRYLEHYNRLVFLVLAVNLAFLWHGMNNGQWWSATTNLSAIANMVLANFALAVLIRQQYVINFLFWLATRAPTSWPLAIRWTLGKVYHFGGLHSGSAMAATFWYGVFVVGLNGSPSATPDSVLTVTQIIMALLVGIIFTAMPWFRKRYHNAFEMIHRFGGWSVLGLFWLQAVLLADFQSTPLMSSTDFWVLATVTTSVILPWLRLKKVDVDINSPSNHVALAKFDHGVTPFPGSSTTLSTNPLFEWHAFANMPSPGEEGFRLAISRAGDWTGEFIQNKPKQIWVKGIPTAGVANIEVLFKKVVYVATGSGIGPCMPHLLAKQVPAHLIWSTRDPRKTYGNELVEEILEAVPDALIWDTTSSGKPDLVELAHKACRQYGAEAVICIANEPLTRKVVYGLELRGIPAYGAIWDS